MSAAVPIKKKQLKHKRRYCRTPGCSNIVKSQGLCQRHGAKPRMCKVPNCPKQAQGNFDGMCKAHFKAHKLAQTPLPQPPAATAPPPPPAGETVYDRIIPSSIGWFGNSADMPLIAHLRRGFDDNLPSAWHRNDERRARGLWPVHNPATQLESWERELVWTEILLLTGNPEASFRHLARGWGRDKGFHMVLAQFICERQGNVERKQRKKYTSADQQQQHVSSTQSSSSSWASVQPMTAATPSAPSFQHHYHSHDGFQQANQSMYQSESTGHNNSAYPIIPDLKFYGDAAYNEALAADLLNFTEDDPASSTDEEFNMRMEEGIVSAEEDDDISSGKHDDDESTFTVKRVSSI